MAFLAPACWEVRTTGNATNGGAFDPISGTPGTDFSQQDSPQITYTDMVIGATTTQFTSVANSPTASLVGNFINVTGGISFTTQRVQVISVVAGVATCDKSLGTAASTGGQGNMGGGLATIGAAAALVVAGNSVYIKASATYSVSSSIACSTSGTSGNPISYIGYTTTHGDNGQATIQLSTGVANGCIVLTGSFNRIYNIILDANSQTSSRGLRAFTGSSHYLDNCKSINATIAGISMETADGFLCNNCVVTGCSGTTSFYASTRGTFIDCISCSNSTIGFSNTSNNVPCSFIRCIAANNTGATSDGFVWGNATSALYVNFVNCIAYNNGRDGLRLSAAQGADLITIKDCIFVNNAGYGINSTSTTWTGGCNIDYNAFYGNSAARNKLPAGAHDVTLTGDPFTNGAGNVFTLNNTAGAGAACRGAGFPGTLQVGGSGALDIGTLQHAESIQLGINDPLVVT